MDCKNMRTYILTKHGEGFRVYLFEESVTLCIPIGYVDAEDEQSAQAAIKNVEVAETMLGFKSYIDSRRAENEKVLELTYVDVNGKKVKKVIA